MPQKSESECFIQRIVALPKGPGISLDAALKPSLDDEAELRRLFAVDRDNPRLRDPYVGLVDVFSAPVEARTTRARVVTDKGDLAAKYVMPLSEKCRRTDASPATVANLQEFKKNWAIFTESSLSQLTDWSNVVAAGGSVLACVSPLPDYAKESKRTIRKYFHSEACPTSDIDLFLYGLTPEEAEKKISAIYEAVRDSVPWDVTCVRTKHTVSIHSQYPYRPVQIVLRLYKSPAEILAGFDVDAPCFAFDGERVWASPRAIVSLMRQCNTIDVTRRSPSYEVRLAKYAARGFEVHVPTLQRHDIDPTIYERSIARITGLARLLALEKFTTRDSRLDFLNSRRQLRGRPVAIYRQEGRRRNYKNDLKADTSFAGLEMNDYDSATLHIPYGPGWSASKIENLIYTTDLKMNSIFNPKNKDRRLHRHPAFFGTAGECLEDCCEDCPEPETDEDRALQESEDGKYIRGRVSFIQENPGRQSISGSFNPIDAGEWSEEAYITETTKFFFAILINDVNTVTNMIENEADVNCRDYIGRAPLHLAILSGAVEVAGVLIDAGARMTARLADGRASLHLAAELGQTATVRKILARSAHNAEEAKLAAEDAATKAQEDVMSESSDVENPGLGLFADAVDLGAPAEEEDTPDVVDLSLADWDIAFTPLAYAILSGSLSTVEEILAAGADPKALLNSEKTSRPALFPLSLTRFVEDELAACDIARLLVKNGASSTTTVATGQTVFYEIVRENRVRLVATLLEHDPNAQKALNFPLISAFHSFAARSPLAAVASSREQAMAVLLLAYGARLSTTQDDILQAEKLPTHQVYYRTRSITPSKPLLVAVAVGNDIAELLASLSSDLNDNVLAQADSAQTILDWVRKARKNIQETRERAKALARTAAERRDILEVDISLDGWPRRLEELEHEAQALAEENRPKTLQQGDDRLSKAKDEYLASLEVALRFHGAKTWQELHPSPASVGISVAATATNTGPVTRYRFLAFGGIIGGTPPSYQLPLFDQLFEACFTGDRATVVQLCSYAKEKDQLPLQIASVVLHDSRTNPSSNTGYTPLHAAVIAQQWDTALLILQIAGKQYITYKPKYQPRFSVGNVQLDEDGSGDDSDSDDSMDTDDDEVEPDVFDVADIPSAVQCSVLPEILLTTTQTHFVTPDRKVRQGNLITKAIWDDDLTSFTHIAELYKAINLTLNQPSVLNAIMEADRPRMLHEYIRRTSAGFVPAVAEENEDDKDYHNGRKVYHGLSVHGTKRKDLARKHDPNTHKQEIKAESPLLWQAITHSAFKVLDYLAGNEVADAYRYYATNSTEAAKRLGEIEDLPASLPAWLGWDINDLGESPLTVALATRDLSDKATALPLLQKLFSLAPKLMASLLDSPVYHTGHNSLLLAVQRKCSTEVAEFLLANGASYMEKHKVRGWNILHIVCFCDNHKLLDYFLRKLPTEASSSLLLQRSKDNRNTPLHIAVKQQSAKCVELLSSFGGSSLTARDVHGYTPLHWAVKQGHLKIVQPLVDTLPPDALHAENGFGETPLETSMRQNLFFRTGTGVPPRPERELPKLLPQGVSSVPYTHRVSENSGEFSEVRDIVDYLLSKGQLKPGDDLTNKIEAYVKKMEAKTKASPTLASEGASNGSPSCADAPAFPQEPETLLSLRAVRVAVASRPAARGLVRLQDVLSSVNEKLRNVAKFPANQKEDTVMARYYSSMLFRGLSSFSVLAFDP
ncbi:ankyrin [Paxillus ammoniavirescens]|nr:ankyrin [Paxillus ammoniavirescens]